MTALAADEAIALIRQLAGGDRGAFGRFYDAYSTLVFSFALRMLRERSAAEDLLQEVFLQVWRDAPSYSPERGTPEAWLVMMTRSRAIDRLRSIRRRWKSFVSMERPSGQSHDAEVESGAAASDARIMVTSALARLPDNQRQVLEMAYFDGLSQTEIAARTNEPLGTVKTRMRAALQRLRELVGKETV
ncbi:MAG TPA: sigma-70 family RNA polymerase sigma factor [Candidatus Binatia bacterium]|jgi:RNA polymerase sigma-70 factor (ECF subfamily)